MCVCVFVLKLKCSLCALYLLLLLLHFSSPYTTCFSSLLFALRHRTGAASRDAPCAAYPAADTLAASEFSASPPPAAPLFLSKLCAATSSD